MQNFLLAITFLGISMDPNWGTMLIPGICFGLAALCEFIEWMSDT
jgi:hypothetical protein